MVENKKPKNITIPSGGSSTYSDITRGQARGRGSGNRGRGGNNNHRSNNRGGRGGDRNPNKPKKSSFVGACTDLKDSIFDVGPGQTLLYTNTLDKILTYAGKNYTPCVRKSIEGMRDMSHLYIIEPTQATPATGTSITRVQQIIFEQRVKDYVKEERQHKMNMAEMFNVIHGQCTKEFIDQMRTYPEYSAANDASDVIALVQVIRKICYRHDREMYKCQAILFSLKALLQCLQHDSSNIDYFEKMRDQKEVLTSIGINLYFEPLYEQAKGLLYPYKQLEHLTDAEMNVVKVSAEEIFFSFLLINNADRKRYGDLQTEMMNAYTQNRNIYPQSVTDAKRMINNYVAKFVPKSNSNKHKGKKHDDDYEPTEEEELLFLQQQDERWEYCGWCKKKHPAAFDDCVRVKNSGITQATTNTTTDGAQQKTGDTDSKQQTEETEQGANFFMDAFTADYESDEDEYGIICTQTSVETAVTVDYNRIKDRTAHLFNQDHQMIQDSWLLLDDCSTINIICNPDLVTNIHEVNQRCIISTNTGTGSTNLKATLKSCILPLTEEVWFDYTGIANIIALHCIQNNFRVSYSNWFGNDRNAFVVLKPDNTKMKFTMSRKGLYYTDTSRLIGRSSKAGVFNQVASVEENLTKYTQRDINKAIDARKFQVMFNNISTPKLLNIVDTNQVRGLPITREDVKRAETIYGPNVFALKGKTTNRKVDHVVAPITRIPKEILKDYKNITLCIDVMFVNGIKFLLTVSRNIDFVTAQYVPSKKYSGYIKPIEAVCNMYAKRGFSVTTILADAEFQHLETFLNKTGGRIGYIAPNGNAVQPTVNTTAENEHVEEAERKIRTVKEGARSMRFTIPMFRKIPRMLVILLIGAVLFWLNCIPTKFTNYSPARIMKDRVIDYKIHCKHQFGEYVQVVMKSTSLIEVERTVDALAAYPTGNEQGTWRYYNITTGKPISHKKGTNVPVPEQLPDRIHALAENEPEDFIILDNHGNVFVSDEDLVDDSSDDNDSIEVETVDDDDSDDSEDDSSTDSSSDDSSSDDESDDESENSGVRGRRLPKEGVRATGRQQDHFNLRGTRDTRANLPPPRASHRPGLRQTRRVNYTHTTVDHAKSNNKTRTKSNHTNTKKRSTPKVKHDYVDDYVINDSKRTNKHKSREQENPYYNHNSKHDKLIKPFLDAIASFNKEINEITYFINHVVLTQYGMRKGLQVFGDRGLAAIQKEMQQFHDLDVITPIDMKTMTKQQKSRALSYLMFLKEKRDGNIKGRGCADGRKQRLWMQKDQTSSPTVSNQALFLSCLIDAKERRDTATADVPGAFLQTPNNGEEVIIRLDRQMAVQLARINPKYAEHMVEEKGQKVIYGKANKALYGTLNASLLFWKDLTSTIGDWKFGDDNDGFILNPYDTCVANCMINGKQCTILWHVDDLKISHEDPAVVTDIIRRLNDRYGKITPMISTRGKVHEYLGMTIDFSDAGKVKITMYDYVDEMISELPTEMIGESATPASSHLFEIREDDDDDQLLTPELSEEFHHLTAKTLFLSKRARPDLQTAVAFLTTRVKAPDNDDRKKLAKLMKYLQDTRYLPLILEDDESGVLKWYIDGSFAIHNDMKSHTGINLTMGKGTVYGGSLKHKLNSKSSTEAELISVSDGINQVLWTRYFLECQGYVVNSSTIYQDNEASILLERNGKRSSKKGTRFINIRYFFITDKVRNGEVDIEYMPTGEMIADYFTKPLQGSLFRKMRDQIQGIDMNDLQLYKQQYIKAIAAKKARLQKQYDLWKNSPNG